MRKIIKWLVCSILLICCSLLVDVSTKITASAQESEVVEEIETFSNGEKTIVFKGEVQFDTSNVDDDVYIPSLAGNLVCIYKVVNNNVEEEPICQTPLGGNGKYSCNYTWDGVPFLARVRLVAGDDNITITKNNIFENYYYYDNNTNIAIPNNNMDLSQSEIIVETNIYENVGLDEDGNMADVHQLKPFIISEMLFLARNYAFTMTGKRSNLVEVVYAAVPDYYNNKINIMYNTHTQGDGLKAFIDVILHEYGHHIQCQIGMIYEHELASHSFTEELTLKDGYTKEKALKIAWIEGWATAFAMQVKNYCILSNGVNPSPLAIDPDKFVVKTITNDFNVYNMENGCPRNGEGCEGSIVGVLWDIWDGGTGDDDRISMSTYQDWWKLTTERIDDGAPILNFSNFINNFYKKFQNDIIKIDAMVEILSHYKIASGQVTLTNASSVSKTVTPEFECTINPEYCTNMNFTPNYRYQLIFYNNCGSEILRSEKFRTTNYKLKEKEWIVILCKTNGYYRVSVALEETSTLLTGGYILEGKTYNEPTNDYFNFSNDTVIKWDAHGVYIETKKMYNVTIIMATEDDINNDYSSDEMGIVIYMITASNTSGNYYNFNVDPNYCPGDSLKIGFANNGDFYYIICKIDNHTGTAYESTLYLTIEGEGGYCWLIGENGTMVDACLRTDEGLVVPFTSIYNNETGVFYLYPTTGNMDMIYVIYSENPQEIQARLEVEERDYFYPTNSI